MTLDVDLVALERQGWQALADGRGGEYYRQHLAADALMAFPFGVMGREAVIEAMEQAPPWVSFELADPKVVELDDGCGIVVYRATAQRAGQPQYEATISSTFVRRDGQWLLVFHQQTPA